MIDLKALAERIYQNKVKNNFPTTNLDHDLELMAKEYEELVDARGDKKAFAKELADIVIFAIGIARMEEIDLEQEIESKVTYNETRTYKKGTFRIT